MQPTEQVPVTVLTARYPDSSMRDWRIAKTLSQIENEDVKAELG